ncbi:MAG: thioredoxin family protein [Planctomycetota bacterium]|nr:thioredoxin family protein [Planctomycetota bacterium]
MRALAATTADLPEGTRPAALLAELEKDPNIAAVSELTGAVNALIEKIYREGEDIEAAREAAALQERLEACLERPDLAGPLREEAKALATTIADVGLGTALWLTNYNEALRRAKVARKPVLAFFTGSDWCVWCNRLRKEVFETAEFRTWAAQNAILLEVDFPRYKTLPPATKKANDALQDKYVIRGFPTVLFLDADGAVLGKSDYPGGGPRRWIERARSTLNGG